MVFTGTCEDKDVMFEGTGEFGRHGKVEYKAKGLVWGNSIDLKAETSVGQITLFGTRLSTSAGDFKSSHEYMMAASRAEFSASDGTMYSGLYADGRPVPLFVRHDLAHSAKAHALKLTSPRNEPDRV